MYVNVKYMPEFEEVVKMISLIIFILINIEMRILWMYY